MAIEIKFSSSILGYKVSGLKTENHAKLDAKEYQYIWPSNIKWENT